MGQRRGVLEEGNWKSRNRSLGGSRNYGYSRSGGRLGSGSESLSWRKSDSRSSDGGLGRTEGGEEVTSPQKNNSAPKKAGNPKRLELQDDTTQKKGEDLVEGDNSSVPPVSTNKDTVMIVADRSTVVQDDSGGKQKGEQKPVGEKNQSPAGKRYKKKGRDRLEMVGNQEREAVIGQKSGRVEEGVEKVGKKGREEEEMNAVVVESNTQIGMTNDAISAGLSEQPRRAQ